MEGFEGLLLEVMLEVETRIADAFGRSSPAPPPVGLQ
jgi:hypothetical protein